MNFSKIEEEILELWNKNNAFELSKEISKDRPEYVFYDGPPFATGLPHYGHILSGTIKDTIARFFFMKGFKMERKFGWDCHGLPVEYEIDKQLNITTRQEIFEMGIGNYNKECKKIVLKYTDEWEKIVNRTGRWIDFKDGYRTMDLTFMESVWHIFKMLYENNSVYLGYRVMPYSTACSTPLSNFEANQNYKEVSDPAVLVSFPITFEGKEMKILAWTTTPWTLPSNLALLINKSFEYTIFNTKETEGTFIMLEERISAFFKEYVVVKQIKGEELLNLEYEPCFDYFIELKKRNFFKIYHADFVSKEEGTGIVHCAPGFGEEDYNALVNLNIIKENEEIPCPIDEKGKFTNEVVDFKGIFVKDADKLIIKHLKERILQNKRMVHRYPYCWRSDTPLLYKLVPNWFIKVKQEIPRLLENNLKINWIPESVKFKKFHNWLGNAKDWSISRNRFWGTPIPLWHCNGKYICIGSIKELEELTGKKVNDIHREFIDDLIIKIGDEEYKRIDEVFDCWFESGSMPYAQKHYPHNEIKLPADFIAEGVDQTRGWFYTLHVISSILFNKPAFLNCIVNGIVLAEDGKKMSKRLKNYPQVTEVLDKFGADSLRLYLISSPVVMAENMNFSEKGVHEIIKVLLIPWYNAFLFYKECKEEEQELEMDDWILNSFNSLRNKIYTDVNNYLLARVFEYSTSFIDDLCNWYIRMNRGLLREGGVVLGRILKDFAIVMAPYVPFFSEFIYQQFENVTNKNVTNKNIVNIKDSNNNKNVNKPNFFSVHYELNLPFEKIKKHKFDSAKKVIEAIRTLREKQNISLKTPLNKATIICNEELEKNLNFYISVIKNECFLLNLDFKREENYNLKITIKPNYNELKKSNNMNEKINLIKELKDEEIENLLKNLKISKNELEINKDELLIEKEIEGASNFNNFSIILDLEMNDHLLEMKKAREFHSILQKLRKKAGFKVKDEVLVYINNKKLKEAVNNYYIVTFTDTIADNYLLDGDFERGAKVHSKLGKHDYTTTIDALLCHKNLNLDSIKPLIYHFIDKKLIKEFVILLKGLINKESFNIKEYLFFYETLKNNLINLNENDALALMEIVVVLSEKIFSLNFYLETFCCLELVGILLRITKAFPERWVGISYYSMLMCIFLEGQMFYSFLGALRQLILISEEKKINLELKSFVKRAIMIARTKNEEKLYQRLIPCLQFNELVNFFEKWNGGVDFDLPILNFYEKEWDNFLEGGYDKSFLTVNNLKMEDQTIKSTGLSFTNRIFKIKDFYKKEVVAQIVTNERMDLITQNKRKVLLEQNSQTVKKPKQKVKKLDLFVKNYNLFRLFMSNTSSFTKEDTSFPLRNRNFKEEVLRFEEEINELKEDLIFYKDQILELEQELGRKVVKESGFKDVSFHVSSSIQEKKVEVEDEWRIIKKEKVYEVSKRFEGIKVEEVYKVPDDKKEYRVPNDKKEYRVPVKKREEESDTWR